MSLPTNLNLNGTIENHKKKEFENGKYVNCVNGKGRNNNYCEMNHSSNHCNNNGKNNKNSFIYDGEKENGDIDDKDNNHKSLNGHNNQIDTEIKEKEFKNKCNDNNLKNEPQNTPIPSAKNLDDPIEDWQILKKSIINGDKVKLVPYTVDHVKTYNEWLNDPYIQQMTGTEPYSLSQEYEYQKEWNDDETKYIFIILDKTLENKMAGDINIFIQNDNNEHFAELNIMIAEEKSRRKGLAFETLSLIIKWVNDNLEIVTFIAKIQYDNQSSIKLFKKLGFIQTEYVESFKEYTYSLTLNKKNTKNINDNDINRNITQQQTSLHYTD